MSYVYPRRAQNTVETIIIHCAHRLWDCTLLLSELVMLGILLLAFIVNSMKATHESQPKRALEKFCAF